MINVDEYIMDLIISELFKDIDNLDVPVGALAVDKDNNLLFFAKNNRFTNNVIHGHAEINLINRLLKSGYKNGEGIKLYVSLEPCLMCAQAICDFGIKEVYYCAKNINNKNISREIFKKYKVNSFELYRTDYIEFLKNFFKNKR